MRIDKSKVVCLLMGGLLAGATAAAPRLSSSWQTIASKDGERVDLDQARIGRMPNGQTAAWTRLTLGFEIPDSSTGINYSAIEAFNTYDCVKREYSTLKRVYVGTGGQAVREEKVAAPRVMSIENGSFEDKLLAQVCKPRAVGQMKDIAEAAALAMAPPPAPEPRPGVMQADMRTEEKAKKPAAAVPVADKLAQAAPAPAPAEAPPQKQRMIDLPKIDKSQVEDPYKDSREKPQTTTTTTTTTTSEKKSSVLGPKSSTSSSTTTTVTAPAPTPPATVTVPSGVSRAEIERQLATFGPRKAKPKSRPPVERAEPEPPLPAHWDYEGEGGPQNWGRMGAANATCASGKRQSPIDIRDGIKVDLEPIVFGYHPSSFSVIDNGHTIQVNVAEGNTIRVMERVYRLVQFHFHRPAEERVNGRTYDMVAHLVHKDDDGNLAVVAVLIEKGDENAVIQQVWNNLPLEKGMVTSPVVRMDLNKLLPENRQYWTYMGSLTTPPCSEGVLWMVMKQPVQVSQDQASIFARLYRNNARPIQASNGRLIKESR